MNHAVTLLNEFLQEVIKNNTYCKTCELNHNGNCFFASECVANDFIHYIDNELEE
jgi:hypothetical protein